MHIPKFHAVACKPPEIYFLVYSVHISCTLFISCRTSENIIAANIAIYYLYLVVHSFGNFCERAYVTVPLISYHVLIVSPYYVPNVLRSQCPFYYDIIISSTIRPFFYAVIKPYPILCLHSFLSTMMLL